MTKDGQLLIPTVRLNRRARKKCPVPSEVYEYVQNRMWHLPLAEIQKELNVSKRVAKALRDGKQIKLSDDHLSTLKFFIGFRRRYCLGSFIRLTLDSSRHRELYIKLNRYLAKVITEMPPEIAKLTEGGWTTRHANLKCHWSPWMNQLLVLMWLAQLKKWYSLVHKLHPEFDQELFAGSGLFVGRPHAEEKAAQMRKAKVQKEAMHRT